MWICLCAVKCYIEGNKQQKPHKHVVQSDLLFRSDLQAHGISNFPLCQCLSFMYYE